MANRGCIYFSNDGTNYQAVAAPTEIKESLQDLDTSSTTRTATGQMSRSVTRGGNSAIRKLELSWELIDTKECKKILEAAKSKFFYVKYPDILDGRQRTGTFYAGDKSVEFKRTDGKNDSMYASLKFNLIEK